MALADLPAFVAEREEGGPRWVWDDTAGGAGPSAGSPATSWCRAPARVVHAPAGLADAVAAEVTEAAATAGRLMFREHPVDFPLSVSVVRSYADAGKAGT